MGLTKKMVALAVVLMLCIGTIPVAFAQSVDLGGMNIVIGDWWSGEPKAPETAQEEATAEYRDQIQKDNNFTIKQIAISGWGENPQTFLDFASTGGAENYVFIMRSDALSAPMQNGLLYDLKTLDCLDFSAEKWNKGTMQLMTKGDHIYGMRPIASEPRFGMFFNKRLLTEAGIDPESIYDLQASGEWTWAAFEDMLKKCNRDTNNDGIIDVFGMSSFPVEFYMTAVCSNMGKFFDVDENGKYYIAAKSDNTVNAMNWASNMLLNYQMPQPEGSNWDWFYTAFKTGQAAFSCIQEYNAGNVLLDMEDDFGFVFFPKGPLASTYQTIWDDFVIVLPAIYDAQRAWNIAYAYNLYTEPTPGYEGADDWKSGFYNIFRDDRAVDETLAMMREPEHGVTWVNPLLADGNSLLGDGFMWNLPAQTVAEAMDAKWPAWQAIVDKANGLVN